jgi:hypothetical protein
MVEWGRMMTVLFGDSDDLAKYEWNFRRYADKPRQFWRLVPE